MSVHEKKKKPWKDEHCLQCISKSVVRPNETIGQISQNLTTSYHPPLEHINCPFKSEAGRAAPRDPPRAAFFTAFVPSEYGPTRHSCTAAHSPSDTSPQSSACAAYRAGISPLRSAEFSSRSKSTGTTALAQRGSGSSYPGVAQPAGRICRTARGWLPLELRCRLRACAACARRFLGL